MKILSQPVRYTTILGEQISTLNENSNIKTYVYKLKRVIELPHLTFFTHWVLMLCSDNKICQKKLKKMVKNLPSKLGSLDLPIYTERV